MSSSGILKVILAVVGIAVIGGLVYYFVLNPGNKYDRIVEKADQNFSEQKYQEAKKLYTEAASIKSEEIYPKEQLYAIDSIQRKLELDIRYDEKVQKADLLYSQSEYLEASQYYFDALNVKPDEAYPVDQIKKIQELLKDPDYEKKQQELAASKAKATPPAKKQEQPKPKTQTQATPAQKQPVRTIADGKYFHVIVGVFENHNNAIEMRDKMIEMGKESTIIQRPGKMEAVTFGSYDNINTAFNFLEFVRNDVVEDAWVLYYETN